MKILLLTEELRLGGAESLAVALAGALARLPGREIVFAAHDGPLRARLDARVRFHPLPLYRPVAAAALTRRLAEILKRERPDIVHSHGATVGVLAALAAKAAGVRAAMVLTDHSAAPTRLPRALSGRVRRLAFDRIVAISPSKRAGLSAAGIPEVRIAYIPNFVDCDAIDRRVAGVDRAAVRAELGLGPGERVVLFAGRLIPGKRVDLFLEILAALPAGPARAAAGLIVGDGPERPRLEALARASRTRAIFLGYQPDIYKYLAVASAFLFPSRREVLPMALIEALAAGVPAICSDIPGNNEIVEEGRTGFLIGGGAGEYAAKLAELLADEPRRSELAARARAAARASYHETVVVGRTAALYDEIAPKHD